MRCMHSRNKLERNGLTVTVRREMGRDIDGACGQLRRKHMHEEQEMEHTGQVDGACRAGAVSLALFRVVC